MRRKQNQSIETDPEMTYMIELIDKDTKTGYSLYSRKQRKDQVY